MRGKLLGLTLAVSMLPTLARAGDDSLDTLGKHSHYFFGTWDCTGKVTSPHSGKTYDSVGQWDIHRKKHSDWVVEKFQNHLGNGLAYRAFGWARYDHLAKKINRYVMNNMGGVVRYVSDGWQGDSVVWDGHYKSLAHKGHVKETITKTDDDTFDLLVETEHHGDTQTMYEGTCTRAGGHGSQGAGDQGGDQAGEPGNDASESDETALPVAPADEPDLTLFAD